MEKTNGMVVEFNTCAYQSKLRDRWYKPSRWAGRLEGLTGLARVCRCPNWVVHTPLVGKSRTEEAGAYPAELCAELAKRIVASWKKTLSLEWWRHLATSRASEVSVLQAAWLRNEEKRNVNRCSGARTERATPITDTLDAESVSRDFMPEAGRPSKRTRREQQNEFCVGGMRNPTVAVTRLALVRELGVRIRKEWEEFAESRPRALMVGKLYGTSKAEFDEEVADEWKRRLQAAMEVKPPDGITLRESVEFTSPLDPDMWDSWAREGRDPERFLGQWAREGAPLGMEVRVDPSNGIFPTVDACPDTEVDPAPELDQMRGLRNYSSMEEQLEDAEIEVDRYMKCGYVKQLPWDWVVERFGKGTVSRLALIVKEKPDGSKKRRVIIDMKRSHGNRRATVDERIVLPRAQDVITMARDMAAKEASIPEAEAEVNVPPWRRSKRTQMEWVLIDLRDAFCHFPVHPRELAHCVSPGLTEGSALVWVAMLFGFKAAPLVMGRPSAGWWPAWPTRPRCRARSMWTTSCCSSMGIARPGQPDGLGAVHAEGFRSPAGFGEGGARPARGVDWNNVRAHRRRHPPHGPGENAARGKGAPGGVGKQGHDRPEGPEVYGRATQLDCRHPPEDALGGQRHVCRAGGRREGRPERSRARPCGGSVGPATKGGAHRRQEVRSQPPLATRHVRGARAVPPPDRTVPREQARVRCGDRRFPSRPGRHPDPLRGGRDQGHDRGGHPVHCHRPGRRGAGGPLWRGSLAEHAGAPRQPLVIRSDSTAALAVARKLASKREVMNLLGAELAICLEELGIPRLVTQHIAGRFNKETDWLSRPHEAKVKPVTLEEVKIVRCPALKDSQFRMALPGLRIGATSVQIPDKIWEAI